MLIFDELKKSDPQIRALALAILAGLFVLAGGLWWVQIACARDYQAHLEMQSFRTVRIPAVRGKILDRNGNVLAENRPTYNVSLYLDDFRKSFDQEASKDISRARRDLQTQMGERTKALGRTLTREEKKQFVLTAQHKAELRQNARWEVASSAIMRINNRLGQPLSVNPTNFESHCHQSLALPFPICTNLSREQIAVFEEQRASSMGVDIEMQSTRIYPNQTVAAHLIGSVHRDDSSAEGEDAYFSYRLPDYKGQLGIEAGYDRELRGRAGVKSVVVNNVGYRQTENIWTPADAGSNVVLTIDLSIQRKAEKALQIFGPTTRGALVVMDVESGDIIAMASSPTIDPNDSIHGISSAELKRRNNRDLRPEMNRATQENYAPGSIFKPVIGLACLEAGIDPNQAIPNPGFIFIGKRKIKDLAAPGSYDFRQAIVHSSNTYFITNGLRAGIENIIKLAQRLHLGERTGLATRQEVGGIFPSLRRVHENWYDGDSANICIGQGAMSVTPLQMAVMAAAIANGGTVLWPRLVDRIEPLDPASPAQPTVFPRGRVRDHLGVRPRNLQLLREAMLADVEGNGGTGTKAAVPGLQICGKTGTAQVMDNRNRLLGETTWFASFAPYEKPRYAVVVMVELEANAGTGGGTCAPIAGQIYKAILERERSGPGAVVGSPASPVLSSSSSEAPLPNWDRRPLSVAD